MTTSTCKAPAQRARAAQPRIVIEGDTISVTEASGETHECQIGSAEGFRLLSRLWLRSGWDAKYVYTFTWHGRPMIQLPEDMLRLQELIFQVRPNVIIETGVAHGGALVFYAGLCRLMGQGRVVGVDLEIRPHNRAALEAHSLASLITLVEGNSIDPRTVAEAARGIEPADTVLVCLDSCHSKAHVVAELEAYAPLVSKNSYIVVMDGIMRDLAGAPRSQPDWPWNNPAEAVREFVARRREFAVVEPPFAFNESALDERVTYWPNCFVQRIA